MGPAVADLNGDGVQDVVIGYGSLFTGCPVGGGVIALNGRNGGALWNYATHPMAIVGGLDSVYSVPAIGDVNGDGLPEVAFGAWDHCVYLLDRAGKPVWNIANPYNFCANQGYFNRDTVWSSPALADLDADGRLEIIIGTDISHENGLPWGGYLKVLGADGALLAQHLFDETIFSGPAVADLNRDGQLDIVVGTGDYISGQGKYVTSWRYDAAQPDPDARLALNWQFSTDGYVFSSPAIGDLDNDGALDVVFAGVIGDSNAEGPRNGSNLYAVRGDSGRQIFRRRLCSVFGALSFVRSSPVLADVAGDARLEILVTQNYELQIINADGSYYTDQTTSVCQGQPSSTQTTYWGNAELNAAPAVADLDNDGDSEVIVAGAVSAQSCQGRLYVWSGHKKAGAPWPQFHRDPAKTGLLDTLAPFGPAGVTAVPSPGQEWRAPSPVSVAWSQPGRDFGAGLAGYSVVWDTAPDTTPDATVEVAAGSTGLCHTPGRGEWYVHLRPVDRAGNAGRSVTAGPFRFDSLSFGNSSGLSARPPMPAVLDAGAQTNQLSISAPCPGVYRVLAPLVVR
jgi:hypothetical protein